MKKLFFYAVVAFIFTACANTEEVTIEKTSDYSKMKMAGTLHNQTMSAVFNQIKSNNELIPTDDYEVMLDSFARIAKTSFDIACGNKASDNIYKKYKYFLDPEAFYTKIGARRPITRSAKSVDATLEKVEKAINSECINLDSLASIDEMIFAYESKGIISKEAANILRKTQDLLCRSSEGTISDAELKRQLDEIWSDLYAAKFSEESFEGNGIAATLYVAQSSYDWWKENQLEMPQQGKVAQWVALDGMGAAAGLLLHCLEHWNDKLHWKEVGWAVANGAVMTSLGGIRLRR